MLTIYKHEMKTYIKTLLIWTICIGVMGAVCVLLFSSVKDSMAGMAESFSSMGAFADAFGMSQLNIATLAGFYATEVGTVHALGGAMFAAILGINILSKEEDGHTGEFLFSLPVAREKVVTAKWLAVTSNVVLLNVSCVILYYLSILMLGEEMAFEEFFLFHGMQLFMHIEVAAICFAISAFMKKNKFGIGLGMVLLLYGYDLMARVIPDLSDYKVLSPFSYANAADIFSKCEPEVTAIVIGVIVLVGSLVLSYTVYRKRDLAS